MRLKVKHIYIYILLKLTLNIISLKFNFQNSYNSEFSMFYHLHLSYRHIFVLDLYFCYFLTVQFEDNKKSRIQFK